MGNAQTGQQVQGVLAELRVLEQRVTSAHTAQRHELEAVTAQLARVQANANSDSTLPDAAGSSGIMMGASARFGEANVLVGPVIGLVTESSARVLLEVDRDAELECHVCLVDKMHPGGREVQRVRQWFTARSPGVFQIADLDPGLRYRVVFSGLRRSDTLERTGTLRTLQSRQPLQMAAVYGNAVGVAAPEEVQKLWGALWRRADADALDVLLHLGGQVDLRAKFSRCAIMISHLAKRDALPGPAITPIEVARVESCVCEELRQVYRDTWNHPEVRRVLAATSNLMIWSDMEASPSPRRNSRVYAMSDEAYPPKLLVLAQRVFREYQRALWDPAEANVAPIPWGVNGTGNEETFMAALTSESAVLFLDSRASQFKPDGSPTPWPVGPLISTQQWQQTAALLKHHMHLKNLIVVTDRPVVPYGRVCENADEAYDEWTVNAKEQSILLNLLFSWRADAEIVLVCGGGPLARPARTLLTSESTSRAALVQVTVPSVTSRCYDTSLLSAFRVSESRGSLTLKRVIRDEPADAFQLEPLAQIGFQHHDTASLEDAETPCFASVGISLDTVRANLVRAEADGDRQPRILLGPVVGQVTHDSAVVLVEVDEACALVCHAQDQVSGQRIQVRVPVVHARRACRFCFKGSLRPDREYVFHITGLSEDSNSTARVHTMPSPEHIALGAESEVAVFAFYRNALTHESRSAWFDACQARARVNVKVTPGVALHLGGQVDLHFAQAELEWTVRGLAKARSPYELSEDVSREVREAIEEAIRNVYRSLWSLADLTTLFSSLANIMCLSSLDIEPPRSFTEDPDLVPWYQTVRAIALNVARDFQVGLRLSTGDEDVICSCGPSTSVLLLSPATLLAQLPHERAVDAPKLPAVVWDALDYAVLSEAAATRVLLVATDEPILDDGPLDAQSRAALDPRVQHSWPYHVDECTRLLDLLFAWQEEKSGRVATLLCGSEVGCSFRTSIIHDRVDPKVAIAQYCLGPVAGTPRGAFVGNLPFLEIGHVDPALLAENARAVKEPRYAYRHKIVGRSDNAFFLGMAGTRRRDGKCTLSARVIDAGELVAIIESTARAMMKRRLTAKSLQSSAGGTEYAEEEEDDDDDDDDVESGEEDDTHSDTGLEGDSGTPARRAKMPSILVREPIASWMMGALVSGEKAKTGRVEEAKRARERAQARARVEDGEKAIKRDYPDLAFPEQPWDTPREDDDQTSESKLAPDEKKTSGSADADNSLPDDAFTWLNFDLHFYGPETYDRLLQWYRIMEDIDRSPTGVALQASFAKYARQDVGVLRRQACRLCRDFFMQEAPERVRELCFGDAEAILLTSRPTILDAATFAVLKRYEDAENRAPKAFPYSLVVPLLGSVGAALIVAKHFLHQQQQQYQQQLQ